MDRGMQKVSIRFFNDREVRAVWDEELSKWWFSVLDVVGVLNDQDDYTKNRNYWKYLKTKLKKEGSELVSDTNQLKLLAQDGKRYKTDVLDTDGILNSCVANHLLLTLSPTLMVTAGAISKLPFKVGCKEIIDIVQSNIAVSLQDWDAHETSWNFQRNELLSIDDDTYMENINYEIEKHFEETGEHICIDPAAPQLDSLAWRIEQYKQTWERKFMQLHKNEEELNRQFIDIYGLQDELTPDVPLSEITILQQGEISIESEQQ